MSRRPSICTSVACCTVKGTAGSRRWPTVSASLAPLVRSVACTVQRTVPSSACARAIGSCTGHSSVLASPAGISTFCAASSRPVAWGWSCTCMGCAVVLRTVNRAMNWSPSRTTGGRPLISCKSWVVAIVVLPVPKRSSPSSAMATISKLVRASLSGTCTWARPWASSGTTGCHSSKVSNNSRVLLRPPPPPGAAAFSP